MVRFGVIGTNWITESFIQAASEVEDFQLTAVYSRTEDRAQEFANKWNIDNTFTELEKFATSDQVDAVYIASPNAMHADQAILCMKSGKHVLVEKAMASNQQEVEQMIQTAKDNKVLLMEALKTTHLPSFHLIRENLHKIGKVRRYFASFCQYSSRYDAYKEGKVLNAFKPELSNGSLMDIGIYCVYPMVALFGEPDNVQASCYMLESGVDGQGNILFDYEEDGINGLVMYSKISNSYVPSEIQGENGSIIIDKISELSHVEIKYNDGSVEKLEVEQKSNTMFYEAQHFVQLIQTGKLESDVNSYFNSLTTAKILEDARKQIGLTFPADKR
ncbi:Gfo/Idh/MocA family protein [Aquibacillus albus]|uniref:Dehydrogenase n=1 Tax=Aquibacillus albus TaxID=1168171 RepID=A0ABS2N3T0_9BACI|nr:Gfo/Idh/MocA family oxidoreductase [Aquibacillus albus]MBM7572800.1 putative dehydrogenase [Aquibacillus albus]